MLTCPLIILLITDVVLMMIWGSRVGVACQQLTEKITDKLAIGYD